MIRKIIVRLAPLFWLIDIVILRCGNRKNSSNKDTVVFVRLDAIGDFVMWLDAARQYRKVYADKTITLICNKTYMDIAKNTCLFDIIIPIDNKAFLFPGNILYRMRIRKHLLEIKAEKVIQAVYSRRIYADYIVSAISAPQKITMKDTSYDNTAKWAENITNKVYTDIIDISESTVMELQKNAALVRAVTNQAFVSKIPVLPKNDVAEGTIPQKSYFVVFPGGSFGAKMWPVERFAKVAEAIHIKTGWVPCICGAANESFLAERFLKSYQGGDVIDLTGKTTLPESIEVIRNTEFLIGNDTSGIHFAAAVDTPSFCVFGGWHYQRFLPYDVDDSQGRPLPVVYCNVMECFHCKIIHRTKECRKHMKEKALFTCIDNISVDEVITAVIEMLENVEI